jgi:hypothetical protein
MERDATDPVLVSPEDGSLVAGAEVPEAHGRVGAGRRDLSPVGAEGHVVHVPRMADEPAEDLPGGQVPDLRGRGGHGKAAAVGAERHGEPLLGDRVGTRRPGPVSQVEEVATGLCVPDQYRRWPADREPAAVGAEGRPAPCRRQAADLTARWRRPGR